MDLARIKTSILPSRKGELRKVELRKVELRKVELRKVELIHGRQFILPNLFKELCVNHDQHNLDHHPEEHWLLHLIDQLSLQRWLSLWVGSVVVSAIFYWIASSFLDGHGVRCTIQNGMTETPISFATAL